MTVTRMGTDGYKSLRFEFNTMFDEPWGDTMEWWFAIAEVLTHWAGEQVPAAWQFRDAPGHHDRWEPDGYVEEVLTEYWDDGSVTTDDLITFGSVLSRYADILRAAGMDY
jgi:hypothetical protein